MRKIDKLSDLLLIPKYQDGGENDEGGYDKSSRQKRISANLRWDPTGGFDLANAVMSYLFKNNANGEENEFYKAYLGLPNSLKRGNLNEKNAFRTEWDAKVNRNADFYHTTDRMDIYLLSYVDTLNLGKMYRDYQQLPNIVKDKISKEGLKKRYDFAKKILTDESGKWILADGDSLSPIVLKFDEELNEKNPIGMFGSFGIRWDKDRNKIQVHDHYDFPDWVTKYSNIPVRPKDMLIRGEIGFNPKKGSKVLNEVIKGKDYPVEANTSDLKDTVIYDEDKVIFINDPEYFDKLNEVYSESYKDGGTIHIKKKNKGKFTETMKRTGKSASELAHSKNPLTRKRAIFALNARKWKH